MLLVSGLDECRRYPTLLYINANILFLCVEIPLKFWVWLGEKEDLKFLNVFEDIHLIKNNAEVGAKIAVELSKQLRDDFNGISQSKGSNSNDKLLSKGPSSGNLTKRHYSTASSTRAASSKRVVRKLI